MITDKHSQTLIFWCQKKSNSRSLTSNLLDKPSVLQHWAVWLIITKFIKQKWTLQECFENKQQYGHQNPTKKHSENFANVKSPFKNQRFCRSWEILSHTFSDFPLEETRHVSPNLDRERSAKYRYSSNMAEYDLSHTSSLTIIDQATKGQIPTLNLPSFAKHFSNIYLFPDLTIRVLTILFRRRFRFQEIRSHVSRYSINFATRDSFRFRNWRSIDGPDDSDDLRRYLITFHFINV